MGKSLGIAALARKLGMSRQRLWQIMQNAAGKCRECPGAEFSSGLCEKHLIAQRIQSRESMRRKYGHKAWKKGGPGRPIKYGPRS